MTDAAASAAVAPAPTTAPPRRRGRPPASAAVPPAPAPLSLSGYPTWYAPLVPADELPSLSQSGLDRLFRLASVLREQMAAERDGGGPLDEVLGQLDGLAAQGRDLGGVLAGMHEALIAVRAQLSALVGPQAQAITSALREAASTPRPAAGAYDTPPEPRRPARVLRLREANGRVTKVTKLPTPLDPTEVSTAALALKRELGPALHGLVSAAVRDLQERCGRGEPLSRPVPQWLADYVASKMDSGAGSGEEWADEEEEAEAPAITDDADPLQALLDDAAAREAGGDDEDAREGA